VREASERRGGKLTAGVPPIVEQLHQRSNAPHAHDLAAIVGDER
jgi:hypothetical protein